MVHAVNKDYDGMAGDFIKLGFLAPGGCGGGACGCFCVCFACWPTHAPIHTRSDAAPHLHTHTRVHTHAHARSPTQAPTLCRWCRHWRRFGPTAWGRAWRTSTSGGWWLGVGGRGGVGSNRLALGVLRDAVADPPLPQAHTRPCTNTHPHTCRTVTSKFNQLVYQYPIRIPERYSLVIR